MELLSSKEVTQSSKFRTSCVQERFLGAYIWAQETNRSFDSFRDHLMSCASCRSRHQELLRSQRKISTYVPMTKMSVSLRETLLSDLESTLKDLIKVKELEVGESDGVMSFLKSYPIAFVKTAFSKEMLGVYLVSLIAMVIFKLTV